MTRDRGVVLILAAAGVLFARAARCDEVAPQRLRVVGAERGPCCSDADLRREIAQFFGEAPFAREAAPASRELAVTIERDGDTLRASVSVIDLSPTAPSAPSTLGPFTARVDRCDALRHALAVAIWGWLQDTPAPRATRTEPPTAGLTSIPPPGVEAPRATATAPPTVPPTVPPTPPPAPQPWPGVRVDLGASLLFEAAPTIAPGVSAGVTLGSPSLWFGAAAAWHRGLSDTFPNRGDVGFALDRGSAQLRACGGWRSAGGCVVLDGAVVATSTVSAARRLDSQSGSLSIGLGVEASLPERGRFGVTARVDAMIALVAPELRVERSADAAVVAAWTSPVFWLGVSIGPSMRIR